MRKNDDYLRDKFSFLRFFFDFSLLIHAFCYIFAAYNTNSEMFEVKGEPKEVMEIRARILDKFKDLTFDEGPHVYTLNGNTLPSVTTLLGKYMQPFDQDTVAKRYAMKHGETAEYWKDQWRFNNLIATTTGTQCHEYGEGLGYMMNGHPEMIPNAKKYQYVAEKNWLIPTRPKEAAMLKFYNELHKDLHFVLAEAKMFTEGFKTNLAGTADILFYYDDPKGKRSGLCVYDWKTNAELRKPFSREKGTMMKPPFTDMYNEPLSEYTLQLNTYSIPLEDLGFKVIAKRVVWVKDDGSYEVIPLHDETKRMRMLLNGEI